MESPAKWIGDMYGPHFLLLYATVSAVTLGICWAWIRTRMSALSSHAATQESDFHERTVRACRNIRCLGTAVILGLGGYKLTPTFCF